MARVRPAAVEVELDDGMRLAAVRAPSLRAARAAIEARGLWGALVIVVGDDGFWICPRVAAPRFAAR